MNILITGGSRGIGAAAVRLFCARGDSVWFLYEKSHEAALALAQETGAAAISCDVADEQAVLAAQLPALDALICNAGIAHYGLISEITPEAWRRIFAVNVDGIFHCVRAALPGMLQKAAGRDRNGQLHVGAGRRFVRGGVFGDEGRGAGAVESAGAGAGSEPHPRERDLPGRDSNGHVRERRAGGSGVAFASRRRSSGWERRRISRRQWRFWSTRRS